MDRERNRIVADHFSLSRDIRAARRDSAEIAASSLHPSYLTLEKRSGLSRDDVIRLIEASLERKVPVELCNKDLGFVDLGDLKFPQRTLLHGATLFKTDFSGANVSGVDFSLSNVFGADFTESLMADETGEAKIADAHNLGWIILKRTAVSLEQEMAIRKAMDSRGELFIDR